MSKFLVFCLHGPLCSWGEVAVGEERVSQAHPTRSAVMGLVAGALGLRRSQEDDLLALDRSLGLAVRVVSSGRPLTDFHTIEVPKAKKNVRHATRRAELLAAKEQDDNPMLSFRHYRQEAFYLACLWERETPPPWPLQLIAQALDRPVFIPSLGRRSCPPALPLAPCLVEAQGIRQALAAERIFTTEAEVRGRLKDLASGLGEMFWDEDTGGVPTGLEGQASEVFQRRDRLASRGRWQYAPRREARAPWPAAGKEG
jgi:CRISPR system Cascade subunit CasD